MYRYCLVWVGGSLGQRVQVLFIGLIVLDIFIMVFRCLGQRLKYVRVLFYVF